MYLSLVSTACPASCTRVLNSLRCERRHRSRHRPSVSELVPPPPHPHNIASDVAHPELGAHVTTHYNTNRAPLDPLLQEHGELRVRAVSGDLSQETAVESLFASASAEPFGPVQVVVVNHARFEERYVPVTQMSLDQWDTTMKTNLTSSFLVVREYMRALEKASHAVRDTAAIVLVGSNGGKWGAHGHIDYAAAKSGESRVCHGLTMLLSARFPAMMYGMCLSLKNEIVKIAPKGRVNVVAPGERVFCSL